MNSYIFASSNTATSLASASLEALERSCEEFFAVTLEDDDELRALMRLLGVQGSVEKLLLSNADFSALFEYSESHLLQLNEQNFDCFYESWLRESGRETSMDEYGQLIFLQGRATAWNNNSNRFVLRERAKHGAQPRPFSRWQLRDKAARRNLSMTLQHRAG